MNRALPAVHMAASPRASLRLAGWTLASARRLREVLDAQGLDAVAELPPPPPGHQSIVRATLRLARASCLVRAGVLQRWEIHHGRRRALVIGVHRPAAGPFRAHAWLEGETVSPDFTELHRHDLPTAGARGVGAAPPPAHASRPPPAGAGGTSQRAERSEPGDVAGFPSRRWR